MYSESHFVNLLSLRYQPKPTLGYVLCPFIALIATPQSLAYTRTLKLNWLP